MNRARGSQKARLSLWSVSNTFLDRHRVHDLTEHHCFLSLEEFKSLQTFNSWRLEKLNSAAIELIYDEEIRLTASCSVSRPSAPSCSLELVAPQDGDSSATRSFFDVIKQAVEKKRSNMTFTKVSA